MLTAAMIEDAGRKLVPFAKVKSRANSQRNMRHARNAHFLKMLLHKTHILIWANNSTI
jgi:hypothetical protein